MRTVSWTKPRDPDPHGATAVGLRERKKRLMRQRLSDAATEMFLERGFDSVKVVEVARACGVSEKTVYNYFPNKESLLLDRWDDTMAALRAGLRDPAIPPLRAALRVLGDELDGLVSWLAAQDDPGQAIALFRRFGTMVDATPALRAHQHAITDQLIAAAAETLASRMGVGPDDPEAQMAGTALLALWRIQSRSLLRSMHEGCPLADIRRAVTGDVDRAAHLIDVGLRSLEMR